VHEKKGRRNRSVRGNKLALDRNGGWSLALSDQVGTFPKKPKKGGRGSVQANTQKISIEVHGLSLHLLGIIRMEP
jgi:hypothetical protein